MEFCASTFRETMACLRSCNYPALVCSSIVGDREKRAGDQYDGTDRFGPSGDSVASHDHPDRKGIKKEL